MSEVRGSAVMIITDNQIQRYIKILIDCKNSLVIINLFIYL